MTKDEDKETVIRAEITPEMLAAAVDILEDYGSECYWPQSETPLTTEEVAAEVWLRMRRIQNRQDSSLNATDAWCVRDQLAWEKKIQREMNALRPGPSSYGS